MTKRLTSSIVNLKIKNGYNLEQFAKEQGLSVAELEREIRMVFSSKKTADAKILALGGNIKKKSKKVSPTIKADAPSSKKVEESKVSSAEETVKEIKVLATVTSIVDSVLISKRLETEQKTKELHEGINKLELQHEEIEKKRAEIRNSLIADEKKLAEIKAKFEKLKQKVDSEMDNYRVLEAEMSMLNTPIAAMTEQLQSLENETVAITTIDIYLYKNGDIIVFDKKVEDFPGWKDIHHSMFDSEVSDNLTGAQLKQLCKLLAIKKELDSAGISFEIISESEEVEKAFSLLKG